MQEHELQLSILFLLLHNPTVALWLPLGEISVAANFPTQETSAYIAGKAFFFLCFESRLHFVFPQVFFLKKINLGRYRTKRKSGQRKTCFNPHERIPLGIEALAQYHPLGGEKGNGGTQVQLRAVATRAHRWISCSLWTLASKAAERLKTIYWDTWNLFLRSDYNHTELSDFKAIPQKGGG